MTEIISQIPTEAQLQAKRYRQEDIAKHGGQQPWGEMSQTRDNFEQVLFDKTHSGEPISREEAEYLNHVDVELF